ncbi:MAG TPA: hypothetical protein DCM28_08350 [Phycisphaerales bacterium]|nr:hypothetical protein [Phycisphaerales bacterium]HCD31037.1 hypothetical protein [Phycisphaerales bacterium]|tara:strand:+ start:14228 stop:16120 length:1893 start_codon:yes stop_codon:yes gene_type:complete
MNIKPFSPVAVDLSDNGFAPYPLEGKVESLLQQASPSDYQATGATRELYLDLSERIVRMAIDWVDEKGAVIDPVTGEEWKQTTPRFVSSAAVLIAYGRCTEYLETVCKSMAYCCKRLGNGQAKDMSPDFWTRELMTADMCLTGIADPEVQKAWRSDLSKLDCEKTYVFVDPTHGKKLHELHNWAIYASGGEALREMENLGPKDRPFLWGREYFDMYMGPQLDHMTEFGMYRDPGDPITYDITTRLQFTTPLAYGFESKLRETYVELQRRGCLTALLFSQADGFVPYGGRSSGFQFQEIILSAMFELEAQRYKTSNPKLAGAFKRQAHLSAMATQRWLTQMQPLRHIKNGFDPSLRHGIDGYGQYSVYTLLTSSFLGLAALYADDTIAEAPTPAELGGYALELTPAFNKVFAVTRGCYVEIDTVADFNHDATGIGRIHFAGSPFEMILSMPFTHHPKYVFAKGVKHTQQPIAIAPTWLAGDQRISLASFSEGQVTHTTTVHEQSPEKVRLTLDYKHDESHSAISETLTVLPDVVQIATQIKVAEKAADGVVYQIPVLVTDGMSRSKLILEDGKLVGEYRGHRWQITWDATLATATLGDDEFANRHAVCRLLKLDFGTRAVNLKIENLGHIK